MKDDTESDAFLSQILLSSLQIVEVMQQGGMMMVDVSDQRIQVVYSLQLELGLELPSLSNEVVNHNIT